MKTYVGNGLGDVYYELLRDITNHGRGIVTRGKRCLELPEPVTLVYKEPGACWMNIPGRKFNPFFALAEVVWILSGDGNVDWISYFNSQMTKFRDGTDPDFHGAYGKRIRRWSIPSSFWGSRELQASPSRPQFVDQIEQVVCKLQHDANSRQAVISLWDPIRDNLLRSEDYPCNNVVYFTLRENVLNQTVVIRSNDVIWGTPYNAIQFTHLLAYVTGCLAERTGNHDLQMGEITYVIQNLHYYLDLYNPILGHLLEKAFSKGELKSEKPYNFATVGDLEFLSLKIEIAALLAEKTLPNSFFEKEGILDPNSDRGRREREGYWRGTVPIMIWLYMLGKEEVSMGDASAEIRNELSAIFSMLPLVFRSLVVDFWRDSKKEAIQDLISVCPGRWI